MKQTKRSPDKIEQESHDEDTEKSILRFIGSLKGTFGDPERATEEIREQRDSSDF